MTHGRPRDFQGRHCSQSPRHKLSRKSAGIKSGTYLRLHSLRYHYQCDFRRVIVNYLSNERLFVQKGLELR